MKEILQKDNLVRYNKIIDKKMLILIILTYLISLFIFFIMAELNVDKFIKWYMQSMDYGNMLIVCIPSMIASILHSVIMLMIAICVRKSKKVHQTTKKMLYILPSVSVLLYFPMLWIVEKLLY